MFENVVCYHCGSDDFTEMLKAQEDLTGKPGEFTFVTCNNCGFAYQNPRVTIEKIVDYYDDEYISHRKQTKWGILTPIYNYVMGKYDRDKDRIIRKYVKLNEQSEVLDVGCAVGTFLTHMQARYGSKIVGVDFKDCSHYPGFDKIDFHQGLFYDQDLGENRFDLITMWHYLEHDYDPRRSLKLAKKLVKDDGRIIIEVPRLDSKTFTVFGDRWPGLQAPQHTVLFTKKSFIEFAEESGLEVVDFLPYGAFPAYFYIFTGVAFKILKGKGINISRWIYPYFLGQILMLPITIFEKYLNLSMQTIILKKP